MLFETLATAAPTVTEGTTGMTGLQGMDQFMSAFTVFIGLLALYSAITGKGPAFRNDYPKAMQADANKMMRKFCWILGPIITVFGVLEYLGYRWAYIVNMSFTLPAVVAYVILFRRRFKQYLK